MIKRADKEDGKNVYFLKPGEYYATDENCILTTVTGTCVVVCLYDSLQHIGGMRHFIVPGSIGTSGIYRDEIAAKAITSMEMLFGEIVKVGGDRRHLIAKIFGAGYINDVETRMYGVSIRTMKFLHEYFTIERIPVESDDLGGNYRRRVHFHPKTGRAFRKILRNNEEDSEFIAMEKEFIENEFNNTDKFIKAVLFD